MTDEMLELAEKNRAEAGAENVEFLRGEIEDIPLPEDHVDVVISNCVINLSTDKAGVMGEAFRVLKPGGRFAVSDMVFLGDKSKLPAEVVRSVESWAGCVSGALQADQLLAETAAHLDLAPAKVDDSGGPAASLISLHPQLGPLPDGRGVAEGSGGGPLRGVQRGY
jgi:SAM-dependent methyltransferase